MNVEEVSGRTVEDAVERAIAKLGVARDHVDVEVIREGKKGLLGFGGEKQSRTLAIGNTIRLPKTLISHIEPKCADGALST